MKNLGEAATARWLTAMFFVLSGLITASWASRIPDVQHHLGLSNSALGTVLFAGPMGQVAALLVAGWITAHFGVQRTMVGMVVVLSAVLLLAGASVAPWILMLGLFGLGFGRTVLNLSMNTAAAEVQRHYPRPIISTFHGMWSLACFAAAGLGTLMIVHGVLPLTHFLLIAGICTTTALVYEWKRPKQAYTPPQDKPFLVKPDRYLALLGAITFCGMLCENVIFDWSVNYFEKVVQAKKGLVTAGYTAFILSMTVGRLLGDRMVGRFGAGRVLRTNGLLLAAGLILAAGLPMLATAIIGFVLIGLGMSVIVPVTFALASQSKKMSPAYALSAVTLIGYAGFLTGPLLMGTLSDWLNMRCALGTFAVFGLGISLLTFRLKRFEQA